MNLDKIFDVFTDSEIGQSCEGLDFTPDNYSEVFCPETPGVRIFAKNKEKLPKITVNNLYARSESVIFVGRGYDSSLSIHFNGGGSIAVLGDNSKWHQFRGKVTLNQDAVFLVGRGVSSWNLKANISSPGVLIGDDVMFGHDVNIRTHSGHCFLDVETNEITTAFSRLLIEPHVWVGEHVKIFKTSFIGSCSVLGYGSLIVSDIPRFSWARGSPAIYGSLNSKLWSRSPKKRDLDKARHFHRKFLD
ncbi:hypothetical protein AAGT95_14650 [Salinicola lusitanus]|uniref:Acyltransferase n=1 Tax=Salinicola lusitanus TaxID=1949085 RepID=A0ABZ3CPH8_9GAMM